MIVPMLLDIDEFNNRLPQNLATFWAFPEISIGHCFSFPCDEQFARCIIRALQLIRAARGRRESAIFAVAWHVWAQTSPMGWRRDVAWQLGTNFGPGRRTPGPFCR
jgi:hypothetical protein